jgi:broad specificity phosphatase PhoE
MKRASRPTLLFSLGMYINQYTDSSNRCHTLSTSFPYTSQITHLVSSPLRRTLYTTLLAFPTVVAAGKKILALPEIQETSDLPCDTGSSPQVLAAEFGADGNVDLSKVTEGWNSKTGRWAPATSAIEARARSARFFLRKFGEREVERTGEDVHIVVVTHGGFLHYFTEDWDGSEKFTGTGWDNTEWRSYNFVEDTGEENGHGNQNVGLIETMESRERRKGKEISLTETERMELRDADWKENGLNDWKGWKAAESGEEGKKL